MAEASSPKIAILLDDLGGDPSVVERIARWRYPVAGAVLPALPGSVAAARRLSRAGKEVLLHLPMEPEGYPKVRPGPGVVLRSQTEEEIIETVRQDLESVPGAVGVNNHMGSAATADPRVMRAVIQVLAERGLFLVDSRTTEATVAQQVAQQAEVPVLSRSVFLDNLATEEAIAQSFAELLKHASEGSGALALGHPYPETLAVLERELPRLEKRGVKLIRLRELAE